MLDALERMFSARLWRSVCWLCSVLALNGVPPAAVGQPHELDPSAEGRVPDGEGCELDPEDCNQNGVPDACDIEGGTSRDCDLNEIPDECEFELTLTQDPLIRGKPIQFQVSGAVAGETVFIGYSAGGQGCSTFCPPFLGDRCLDILGAVTFLGTAVADASGTATLSVVAPDTVPLLALSTQAAIARGPGGVASVKSNPITSRIMADVQAPPAPSLDSHTTLTQAASVAISGTAASAIVVEASGPAGVFQAPVVADRFDAVMPLESNRINRVFVTSINSAGVRSAPTATAITHDAEAPLLFIDIPADGEEVTTSTADVAGRISDRLGGSAGLTVTVNGTPAEVDVGIGTNGTFLARDILLVQGQATVITASAVDSVGNSVTKQVTVTQVPIPPNAPRIEVISGGGQTGQVHALLPQPLVVRVTRIEPGPQDTEVPFVGKLVTFDVARNDGRLSIDGQSPGSRRLQVFTDTDGIAQAYWTLGGDAGCGNQRVEVESKDVFGTALFSATATPEPAIRLSMDSGNEQRVEVGAPAAHRLRVWVSDGCNGVEGVPVTFTVTQGSGTVDGQSAAVVSSGSGGYAEAEYVAGIEPGNQRVEANFTGNQGSPAQFVIVGVARDATRLTSFSGLVLNNAQQPIQGAVCTLSIGGMTLPLTVSDIDGRFRFDDLPVSGPATVVVNGLSAFHVGGPTGRDVPLGSFPVLEFQTVLVPNAENTLSDAVRLAPLDPVNSVVFDNTEDVELTIQGVDGVQFTIKAGSMTRADGSVPAPGDAAMVSLNRVNHHNLAMPFPRGAAPQLAWTFQPAGATFDPPVEVIYPNVSGLPAGGTAYFMTFDHDTERFEIVASGQVTDDGAHILSDPGSGITLAGWGGHCPPYVESSPGVGMCEPCDDMDPCTSDLCVDGTCVSMPILCDDSDPCTTDRCEGGVCVADGCDDGIACTEDTCELGVGCNFDPIDTRCDDSDACTLDSCSPGSGGCVNMPDPDCGACCSSDDCVEAQRLACSGDFKGEGTSCAEFSIDDVIVNVRPTVPPDPVCGQDIELIADVIDGGGGALLHYTWFRGTDIVGDGATLALTDLGPEEHNESFKVLVTNGCDALESPTLLLQVDCGACCRPTEPDDPCQETPEGECVDVHQGRGTTCASFAITIVDEPTSQTVCEGDSVTLTVDATAPMGALQYQWMRDGLELTGETGRTLELAAAAPSDSGEYTCVVTNADCAVAMTTPAEISVFRAEVTNAWNTQIVRGTELSDQFLTGTEATLRADVDHSVGSEGYYLRWTVLGVTSAWQGPYTSSPSGMYTIPVPDTYSHTLAEPLQVEARVGAAGPTCDTFASNVRVFFDVLGGSDMHNRPPGNTEPNWFRHWGVDQDGACLTYSASGTVVHFGVLATTVYGGTDPSDPMVQGAYNSDPLAPQFTLYDPAIERLTASFDSLSRTYSASDGSTIVAPFGAVSISLDVAGIDNVNVTLLHEAEHLHVDLNWQAPNGQWYMMFGSRTRDNGNGSLDTGENDFDNDELPNVIEDMTIGYRWDDATTFYGFYLGGDDEEVWAESIAVGAYPATSRPASDWAFEGAQSTPSP